MAKFFNILVSYYYIDISQQTKNVLKIVFYLFRKKQ